MSHVLGQLCINFAEQIKLQFDINKNKKQKIYREIPYKRLNY